FAMAIHQHLPRAILAHQNLVILQLYSRLSHNIAGIVELPLRLVKHVFTDLADIADEVREKSIAWIKPPVRHDGVQFRQLALMRFYERQLIWRDVVLQINWLVLRSTCKPLNAVPNILGIQVQALRNEIGIGREIPGRIPQQQSSE